MPRIVTWLALVVVALAGCQSATESPGLATLAPSAPPPTGAASSSGTGVPIDPDWITRPALTCGDERRFPPEAIAGVGLAELGLYPAAGVLRAFLADTADPSLPDAGWHRVHEDQNEVTFVTRGGGGTPWVRVTVGVSEGRLEPLIYGQCHLQPVAPEGVTLAHWWLDPDAAPPAAGSTAIAILLREQACASGKPPVGRVLPPTVMVDADAITVAIGVTLTPGGADCQANPSLAMELTLPEPLGARTLFDAGVYPPRLVTTEDPG